MITPAAFRDHFGTEPPDTARGMRLAAIRFAVRDLGVAQQLLGGMASERMNRLVVGPDEALGATLVFER